MKKLKLFFEGVDGIVNFLLILTILFPFISLILIIAL